MQIIQKQLDYTMKKVTNIVGLAPKKFEYVVLHEVCHLKHMNHSKQFWQMVEGYMPDYKKYKKELNLASMIGKIMENLNQIIIKDL